ncbi:GTPase-associated protein 1-related protein [Streptomyces sp. NPDC057939]|uniref:GTPase-associated protein 1-related protein n=1 Tax=Streptomyces sp. NPDC057939 TaxID=3346284 RepID=UPI0036E60222
MNLAQLHYASGTPGPEGSGPGFTSVTPGVPAALLREAGRLIGYEPPDDAPAHPSAEQLAALPVALSLSILSDGSRLLARSACTDAGTGTGADAGTGTGTDAGTDTGAGAGPARPGVGLPFHAHAVHLPGAAGSGAAQGALPITAWGSPQWASRTPPGGPPPPLAKVPAPGRHDAPGLAAFVAARGARLAGFFADVRRLGMDPEAPRIVLVERDSLDVARWVMLACSVLPHQRGQWLTFTTYTRRPGLAPQQLIGVRPGGEAELAALAGREHRYRILDPAREPLAPADSDASAGPWARTAALVWLAGRPQLFAEVRQLPGDPYDAGPLAALALAAGLPLDPAAHAEAAEWTAEHGDALPDARDRAPRRTPGPGPTPPAPAPAPLLSEARPAGPRHARRARHAGDDIRDEAPHPAAEADRAEGVPPGAGSGVDGPHGVADRRTRMAAALGVGPAAPLPEVARRLALALLGDPERAYGEDVRDGLAELPALRILVLDRLDALSAGDPAAGVRLFEHTGMRLGAAEAVPHLRMCARATEPAWARADRVVALDTLLRDCGVSLYAEPLVLRTGMRLVWGAEPLPADEARLVLATTGAPVHRDAGTWDLLALAAVRAPAGDPAASDLAREVLGHFATELPERLRRELLLVETAPGQDDDARPDERPYARDAAHGETPPDDRPDDRPADRATTATRAGSAGRSTPDPAPRTSARPDAPVDGRDTLPSARPGADGTRSIRQDRRPDVPAQDPEPRGPAPGADAAAGALAATAARLLAPDRSGAAGLRALIDSEDAELLSAYRRAAHDPRVGALLRRSPRFLADCFAVWSSHPQAGPLWQETRTDLLEGVLRPAVRDLSPERLLEAEEELAGHGARRAEEFRAWRRPGALAGLRERLSGLLRRRPLPPDPGPGPGPATTAAAPDRPAGADWAGVTRRRVIPPPPNEPPRNH